MNKKKLALAAIIGITSLTFGAVVLGTVSWFQTMISIPKVKISGNSAGAYFAYGNGSERPVDPDSKDKPYGISHPRHLYNLAWLQYMGFFADGQYYFELADSIPETGLDMTGWILPPIGTEGNPFVGNFNGNGKIIKNLTISNDEDTLFDVNNKHPNDISYTAPEIVGLFGVVGNLNGAYTGTYVTETNSIDSLGLSNITIDTQTSHSLAGIVAGYSSGDINNVSVNNSKIDVASGTGCLENGPTSNISDHGVVGFTTDTSKITNKSQSIYSVEETQNINFNASDTGEDTGWGGSIDMKTVHSRLNNIRNTYATQTTVATKKSYHYLDGTIMNGYPTNTSTSSYYRTYTYDYNRNAANYNNKIGSYMFRGDSSTASSTSDQWIHYLSGGHNSDRVDYTSDEHEGFFISDGTYYLSIDDTGTILNNVTNSSNATIWTFSATSGTTTISTTYNGVTYYLYNSNGVLTTSASSSTWSITTNGDSMQLKNNSLKIGYYSSKWQLLSDSGEPYYVVKSGSNNYMTSATSGNTPGRNASASSTYQYYLDDNNRVYYLNGNTKLYLAIYYTYDTDWRGEVNSHNYNVRLINSLSASNYYYMTYENGVLKTSVNVASGGRWWSDVTLTPTTTYITYSSGWTNTASSGSAATYTVGGYIPNATITALSLSNTISGNTTSRTGPGYYQTDSQNNVYRYDSQDVTYFPLNAYKEDKTIDGVLHKKHEPNDSNTGYIMGGGSGNVRISYYTLDDYTIKNDDGTTISDTNRLQDVHTYTDDGDVVIGGSGAHDPAVTNYEKFEDSFNEISNVISGSDDGKYTYDGRLYGLHFMDSTINTGNLVTALTASINGDDKTNYKMPANAIDFNLKEKGYINFFAGTYGNVAGNNNQTIRQNPDSFFSLHMIQRSGNEITAIKEIEEVWSDGNPKHSYVYKIKNGGYTTPYSFSMDDQRIKYVLDSGDVEGGPYLITDTAHGGYSDGHYHELNSKPSGYTTCKFKTIWITNETNIAAGRGESTYVHYRTYYFEIPMNEGEFCLGSVPGATFGAYLFYLDIGANAAKTNRTQFVEKFHVDTIQFEYPNGIQVTTPGTNPINNADTIAAAIIVGFSGEFELIRNGTDVTLKGAANSNNKVIPKYRGQSITLVHASGSDTDIAAVPKISESKDVLRLQFYDYNILMNETTHTIITDESTDNWVSKTRTIKQWKVNSDGTETPVATPKIYRSSNGVLYKGDEINDLTFSSSSSTIWITFEYEAFNLDIEIDEKLIVIVDENNRTGKFYTFNGYNIVFTVTGGTLTVTVTELGSTKIKINGQTVDEDHLVFQIPLP